MKRRNQEGSALVLGTIMSLLVAGMSSIYLTASVSQSRFTLLDVEDARSFFIAEAGVAEATLQFRSGLHDGETEWTLAENFGEGDFTVDVAELSPDQIEITSRGRYQDESRTIQTVVEKTDADLSTIGMGAVVNLADLTVSGNITVDGRDYSLDGSSIVGPGVEGIVTEGNVTQSGNSEIGGNGNAPMKPADSSVMSESHDPESDGIDNDHDGDIDEIGEVIPTDPDGFLGLPPGALKSLAQSQGTYFETQAEFDNYRDIVHGGNLPGKEILYLNFDLCVPTNLGPDMNDDPSVLVIHNATSDAVLKNIHGSFKGLVMADGIDHVNGSAEILGMVFSGSMAGNAYGNGNSDIHFSSAVLNALDNTLFAEDYKVKSWIVLD